MDAAGVDRLCEALFLSLRARERDDNLLFVRERLLHSEADLAGLLDLYQRVRQGKPVVDDETDPLVTLLRLSGVVRAVEGTLRVRNRIYEWVFDRKWVRASMQGAELRRQRAAFRRGLWRAAAVAAVIVVGMGGLALTAVVQARRAARVSRQERVQRLAAQERQRALQRQLYVSQMILAQEAWDAGNLARAREILEAQRPQWGEEDLRGFEWRLLWRLCRQDAAQPILRLDYGEYTQGVLSPDGRLLATPKPDQSLELWDPAARRRVARMPARQDGYAVRFSPNGRSMATTPERATEVKLWDVATRRQVATLRGNDFLGPIAYSGDSRVLATAARNAIHLWDTATGRRITSLPQPDAEMNDLAFLPDGRLVGFRQKGSTLEVWDLRRRGRIVALPGGETIMRSPTVSPDGRLLAASEPFAGRVRVWELAAGRSLATFSVPSGSSIRLAFAPGGRQLATGGGDFTLRVWDLMTSEEEATLRGHNSWINTVQFTPDSKTLVSASWDGTVRFWPVHHRDEDLLRGVGRYFQAMAYSPDGRRLATGDNRGYLKVWDVATKGLVASMRAEDEMIPWVVFSPDGKRLASSSWWGTERVWDLAGPGGRPRQIFALKKRPTALNHPTAFSPDGRTLAVIGETGEILDLWDLSTRREIARMRPHTSDMAHITDIAFTSDGRHVVTGSGNTLRLWDIARRREVARFRHNASVFRLALSPDNRFLACGGGGDTVRVWDFVQRREVASLKGYTGEIVRVQFSPDGRRLITSDANGPIHLWSTESWAETAAIKEPRRSNRAVALSPDGDTLAVGRADGTVHFLRAAPLAETDLPVPVASGGDRRVLLQWRPLAAAHGYHVYRVPANAGRAPIQRLDSRLLTTTSFLDRSPDLVNGHPQTYAVAALFPGSKGRLLEGPRVRIRAMPLAAPAGWIGSSIGEGPEYGSAVFDPRRSRQTDGRGEILLRGAGEDIWNERDRFYFLNRLIPGDFEAAVTVLTLPTGHSFAKAGLMIREGLDPAARHTSLVVHHAEGGVQFQWRPSMAVGTMADDTVPQGKLHLPILLRLTRRGVEIRAEYSQDGGKSFHPADEPVRFSPPLAPALSVGLAITSHDPGHVSEARFRDLRVTPLRGTLAP